MTASSSTSKRKKRVPEEETVAVMVAPAVKEEARLTVTMACVPRLGSYTCVGLSTGNAYTISNTGTSGVDLEDADIISSKPIRVRCIRTAGWIEIIPAGIVSYD